MLKNKFTYLMAPFEIVAEFSIYSVKASKIERLLHKYFDKARAGITIENRFSTTTGSTEWFFVLPQTVKETFDLLIIGDLGKPITRLKRQKFGCYRRGILRAEPSAKIQY